MRIPVKNGIVRMQTVRAGMGRGVVFAPGLFLILLGVAAVLMPSVVVALLAGFLVFVGAVLCAVAWKVMRWKRRFEQFSRDLRSNGQALRGAGLQGTFMFRPPFSVDPLSGDPESGDRAPGRRGQGGDQIEVFDTDDSGEKIKIILH